ncbi:MAG TPA: autotransporter domain-containing protein [Casimicrobiaceae bacterium]
MRNIRASLAALGAACVVASPSALAQFSNAFVFGDSLSDAGQYGARFTTNPGLSFAMYVTERYGYSVGPSFQGGNDYGQGGARVNSPSPLIPPNAPNLSIADQVTQFLGKGPLDSNALYQLQGGANDIRILATQAAAGQITPEQLQAGVTQAALDLATQATRLKAAGARYLIVYNMPDIGKTPDAAAARAQATFTSLSSLFNSTLNAALSTAHLQIIQFNTFALLNEIVANPAGFGFINVTTPVCTTASALDCTPSTLRDPTGNLTWAFADGIHPTTGLAQIFAQAAESMIEGPAKMSELAEAPLGVEAANFRSIDARMISGINSPRPMSKYEFWGAYDYGNNDFKGNFLSGNADLNTLTVGGDIKVSPQLLIGAMFGYTENKGDFGGGTGGYKLNETSGTIYLGYGPATVPWWIGATLGVGDLDYKGIHRDIALGALTRSETADARGWHIMTSVLGGYWFIPSPDWQHGPWARVGYQDIHVDNFCENGSDSTALCYGKQTRTSLITSVGWQVTGRVGIFRPYARVTWDNESRTNQRDVSASPVALYGPYSIPGIKPDSNWLSYAAGASADFGRVTGFLVGSGTSGKSDGNGYAVTVGVRVPI